MLFPSVHRKVDGNQQISLMFFFVHRWKLSILWLMSIKAENSPLSTLKCAFLQSLTVTSCCGNRKRFWCILAQSIAGRAKILSTQNVPRRELWFSSVCCSTQLISTLEFSMSSTLRSVLSQSWPNNMSKVWKKPCLSWKLSSKVINISLEMFVQSLTSHFALQSQHWQTSISTYPDSQMSQLGMKRWRRWRGMISVCRELKSSVRSSREAWKILSAILIEWRVENFEDGLNVAAHCTESHRKILFLNILGKTGNFL